VASHALTYSRQARFVRPALVDGAPGLAIAPMRRIIGALAFTVTGGRITEIRLISVRARLRAVKLI
jgi:RNA polymerase sigma-70 factor (ECF subfamily)